MNDFSWIDECQQAFEKMKKLLGSPPLLSKSKVRELYLYLAASLEAVSSMLFWLDDKGTQKSIYYTSWVLHDTKTRYSKSEKIVYTLIIFVQHFRPYFQAYSIIILTDQTLKTILQQPDTSKRIVKWVIKLN